MVGPTWFAFRALLQLVVCALIGPTAEKIDCVPHAVLVEMVIAKDFIIEEVVQMIKEVHAPRAEGHRMCWALPCQSGLAPSWQIRVSADCAHTEKVLGMCCKTLARQGRTRLLDTLHWFPEAGANPLTSTRGYDYEP